MPNWDGRIGEQKGMKLILCCVEGVKLNNDIIKILGICYPYDKKIKNEKNFLSHLIELQNLLNMWRMG